MMEQNKVEYQTDFNEKNVLSENDRHRLENKRQRKFIRRFLNKHVVDYDQLDDDSYEFLYK